MNTCQPMYHNICVTPLFTKDDDSYYTFDGLTDDETEGRCGINSEYRFIVNTLRQYFGDDLEFEEKAHQIKIAMLSVPQMKVLRIINEDTCEFPIKYGRSKLKFEITGYSLYEPTKIKKT